MISNVHYLLPSWGARFVGFSISVSCHCHNKHNYMHVSNTSILEDMTLLWLVGVRRCGASSSNDECLPNECVHLPMRRHMRMMCFGERSMQWFRMIDCWTLVWCIISKWMLAQRMCPAPHAEACRSIDRLLMQWFRMIDFWTLVWCIMTKWMLAQQTCPELIMKRSPCQTYVM